MKLWAIRHVSACAFAVASLLLIGAHTDGVLRSTVAVFITTADASRLFEEDESGLSFTALAHDDEPTIDIDERQHYQVMDGFGAAVSGSSVYLLSQLPDHGRAVLAELFNERTGIGLSYARTSIGSSDFSLGSYTYDDVSPGAGDPRLQDFSMARDAQTIALLETIHANAGDVRFIASPWTAPAWMKSGDKLFGGTLRPSDYGVYARYLATYVRDLASHGIILDALTPQNEPLLDSDAYPSMRLNAASESAFVRTALGPALSALPQTKLLINDHNWDDERYPRAILRDAATARYVSGLAFHCYAGNVMQMSAVERSFPQKGIYLTECSGGAWSPNFRDNLRWDMENLVIGGPANWAKVVLLGNLALDAASGPANGGCSNCRGVVTIHPDGSITRNVEYYVLAHVAKFVRPGAVRIASSSPLGATLPNVAFENLDGSKTLIVFNAGDKRLSFQVREQSRSFPYTLPEGAAATFHWM